MHFRLGLCDDAPPDPLVGWGGDTPPHTPPHSVRSICGDIIVISCIFGETFTSGTRINVLTAHAQTLSLQTSMKMVSRARNDSVFIGKQVR